MFEQVESMSFEEHKAQIADYQKRAGNLLDDIKNKEVTVQSGDRMVTVTAGSFGRLINIQISPYALRRMSAEGLSASVLATAQQALNEAGQGVLDLVGFELEDS